MQEFPEEVLEEILLRLRVVDLLRCKSVCKRWNSIISSTYFIQLHLKKSTANPSRHRILMPYPNDISPDRILMHYPIDTLKTIDCNDLYHGEVAIGDIPAPCETYIDILGSCDGLVSYYNEMNGSICVWNPAMRISKSLKTMESTYDRMEFSWFGRESSDEDEHKLVIGTSSWRNGVSHQHIHLIRPYADEDGDWRSTQGINKLYRFVCGVGTIFNGRVHWPAYDLSSRASLVVFSYDLRCETMAEVPAHVGMDSYVTLCVINGRLSAIHSVLKHEKSMLEVWMMKEYGVQESWTKLTVLSGIHINSRVPFYGDILNLNSFFVGVSEKGDLIVNIGGRELVLYNMEENKSKTLTANGCEKAIMYVESLVLPPTEQTE